VTFSSKLNFSAHIATIIAKAKQRLYLIRKCFTSSNDLALIIAFKTYIIPILEYCSPVWSPGTVTDKILIESVQRSFTKSLYSCNSLAYSQRLENCNLKSLEYRRLFADLVLFYKVINKLIIIDFGNLICPLNHSITRGHSMRFVIPAARTNCRLNFFVHRTIPIRNKLCDKTVTAISVHDFKTKLLSENLKPFLIF